MDNRHAGFMRSFPNYIPLSARAVRGIAAAVEPYRFDAIHGAWWGRSIATDARAALRRSVERYVGALEGAYDGRRPESQGRQPAARRGLPRPRRPRTPTA